MLASLLLLLLLIQFLNMHMILIGYQEYNNNNNVKIYKNQILMINEKFLN